MAIVASATVHASPVTTTELVEVSTPSGPARYVLDTPAVGADAPPRPVPLLVLGHGAGGDVDAADLLATRDAALHAGVAVARVTQPYRVAGRRAPAPAASLDVAWLAALTEIRSRTPYQTMIVGGRSSGARVACRTSTAAGASAVVALAFPLHPPGKPERSRAPELQSGLPTLVVNGSRDAFGVPDPDPLVHVHVLPGETHALNRNPVEVGAVVIDWLRARGFVPIA
jgi:uncharacterized protein